MGSTQFFIILQIHWQSSNKSSYISPGWQIICMGYSSLGRNVCICIHTAEEDNQPWSIVLTPPRPKVNQEPQVLTRIPKPLPKAH
jgi:hypothetical protein